MAEIKNLGVTFNNAKNCFKTHKENMIKKARNLANMTYSIVHKSCNKLLIGKTYWKSVALPTILYGAEILNLTEKDIKTLECIENSVYRQILGASKYTPVCCLRGEIGASSMKARITKRRLLFLNAVMKGRN